MSENKYCAIARECAQVSPDDWEMITTTMEVNENTTMHRIAEWYNAQYPRKNHFHIVITKLDKPQP